MVGFFIRRSAVAICSTVLFSGSGRWRSYVTGRIARDEEVILFPTLASFHPEIVDEKNNDDTSSQQQQHHSSSDAGTWTVPIHGWIFEPERRSKKRRAFLKLLRKALQIDTKEVETQVTRDILTRRVQPFLVDNERWKSPPLRIGTSTTETETMEKLSSNNKNETAVSSATTTTTTPITYYNLPLSGKNGHFRGTVNISFSPPQNNYNSSNHNNATTGDTSSSSSSSSTSSPTIQLHQLPPNGLLPIEAHAPPEDGRIFRGVAHLIPPTGGISVISDIDDTIKISNVTQLRTLLQNTFLKEFRPIPGMAELYQNWSTTYNASFHFVSSSPYQLYEELETFRQRENFPPATYHLRTLRPKESAKSLLQLLWSDPFQAKTNTITTILDQFPNRKFVLVGDAGERDPEVYGHVARLYPNQIVKIFIRRIVVVPVVVPPDVPSSSSIPTTSETITSAAASSSSTTTKTKIRINNKTKPPMTEEEAAELLKVRMETAFADLPANRWCLFEDANEIELLPSDIK